MSQPPTFGLNKMSVNQYPMGSVGSKASTQMEHGDSNKFQSIASNMDTLKFHSIASQDQSNTGRQYSYNDPNKAADGTEQEL